MADVVIRNIGIIPRKEIRKEEEDALIGRLEKHKDIIPYCNFHPTSYRELIGAAVRKEGIYDVVLAFRMSDRPARTAYNICIAAYEIRKRELDTLLLISFNRSHEEEMALVEDELVTGGKLKPEDKVEPLELKLDYLNKLEHPEEDHYQPDIRGIVFTSGRDLPFIFNLIKDMLWGPDRYLEKIPGKHVRYVENQHDFLNFPPGHTEVGLPRR